MAPMILREDALQPEPDGASLRISQPWIRSLPLACLQDVSVTVDGIRVEEPSVRLGQREIAVAELATESGWWFVQDRVVLSLNTDLSPGEHRVAVSFRLLVPYLPGGPDAPLVLTFHDERTRALGAPITASDVSRDVA